MSRDIYRLDDNDYVERECVCRHCKTVFINYDDKALCPDCREEHCNHSSWDMVTHFRRPYGQRFLYLERMKYGVCEDNL